jgi:N-acyl-D-aspartate/D-glutamate deacylase
MGMAEFDLVIRGGTFVDGTGVPKYRADVAVKDGRVAKVGGKIRPGAAKELDASGCFVAPGAIDLHTHYDAQLNWDPYASLSGWHGVTSLTVGECGFGFAPVKPEDREQSMRMMNRIEAIPLESMRLGMRWDWETFPEYLDSLERQGLGVNVGALVPFSPLRGYVLGMEAARERTEVSDAELDRMRQLFYEGMKAGAFGFALDKNMEDRPEDGTFLPSHVASDAEFLALAEVLGELEAGHIGLTLGFGYTPEARRSVRNLLKEMMRVSRRPLHLLDTQPREDPSWAESCRAEGLLLFSQHSAVLDTIQRYRLAEYNMFDYMPAWVQPLIGTPAERAAKLRSAETRAAMERDIAAWPNSRTDWNLTRVGTVAQSRNAHFEGMTINELAAAIGKPPLDAFLELALDEDLETEFEMPLTSSNSEMARARGETMKNPNAHISMSDGGAHTRFLTLSTWPIWWLSYWVRDQELMSLEQAHFKMSALPAWITDFKNRGTLRVGDWADIIVYDLDRLGFVHERPVYAYDFPGGEKRIIQKPTGLRYTLVNGTVTFEENVGNGALPGKLLRSCDPDR